MKLKGIKINNFRNVPSCDIDLCKGEFVSNHIVYGVNMSGKTNTLNAIHWAFTGADLEGSVDNRANFNNKDPMPIKVELDFGDFKFSRICEMVDGTPTVSIEINGEKAKTVKAGEAMLHAKLGLTDIILEEPTGFDILKFLLNPLYFTTVAPKSLRMFMLWLSKIDLNAIAEKQNKVVSETLKKYDLVDPYKLGDAISKEKKKVAKVIDQCKGALALFPSVKEEAEKMMKEQNKQLALIKAEEANAQKYALSVSKELNKYFQKAMGIKVCLLEEGVGEDVFKDVCYPILPKSKLPFDLGSYAEKTLVATRFINELTLTYNITPLPLLIDNMESLDDNTFDELKEAIRGQFIGACVEEEDW